MIKKSQTVYYCDKTGINIAVSEETKDHMSVYDGIEPCSGVLRHWGSKENLIKELKHIIKLIEDIK